MVHMKPSSSVLDARRLLCPLPVIRTSEKIDQLENGQILDVLCTDPGALADIPAWCRMHGHQIVAAETDGLEIKIRVQVSK